MQGFLSAVLPYFPLAVVVLGVLLIVGVNGFCESVLDKEKAGHRRGQERLLAILATPEKGDYVWISQAREEDPEAEPHLHAKDRDGTTLTLAGPSEVFDAWHRLQAAGVVVHLKAPVATVSAG